jgi:glycine/D-amino acid oxidase-like deaminating enzyme
MTKYSRSPWLDQFPKSRVPAYGPYRGARQADAVIIGGGLTGCATAYALAMAGMKTVLLEAGLIGRGNTAYSSGWISDDPGVSFAELEKAIGLRRARYAWQSWRRAALDFSALLRRLQIKCQLQPASTITVAATPEQLTRLRKDQKARVAAGLESPFLPSRVVKAETAIDAAGALRGRDSARIDPYRACVGLAAEAARRGVDVCERSPVRRVTFTRKYADVIVERGTIRTRRVVVATGMPTATLFRSLARHFWFRSTYLVMTDSIPARVRQHLGRRTSIVRDSADPPHLVEWVADDRMIVTGADVNCRRCIQKYPASSRPMAGRPTTRGRSRACPTSALTGTSPFICLHSAIRAAASPVPILPVAFCYASAPKKWIRPTKPSDFTAERPSGRKRRRTLSVYSCG